MVYLENQIMKNFRTIFIVISILLVLSLGFIALKKNNPKSTNITKENIEDISNSEVDPTGTKTEEDSRPQAASCLHH